MDLCEIRMIIEPEIAALAAERATEEEVEELQKTADEVAVLCRQGTQHMEKDIEFHEKVAKYSKNSVTQKLIPVIQAGVSVFIHITDLSLAVDAIRARNPQKAREAMIEHLRDNKEKIEEMGELPQ